MEQVFYDPDGGRLVFVRQKASEDFWDRHWKDQAARDGLLKSIQAMSADRNLLGVARRYLKPGARILEGGCGMGGKVYGLRQAGYEALGVDFAPEIISAVNQALPQLDLRQGDIRALEFADAGFDAYYSLGVIEHFYDGFEQVLKEAWRVLKPDGLLLIYVPAMSWLRRQKARRGAYPIWQPTTEHIKGFYQFALEPELVIGQVRQAGFELISREQRDGLRGLKVESSGLKKPLDALTRAPGRAAELARRILEPLLKSWAGHSCQMIFRKKPA